MAIGKAAVGLICFLIGAVAMVGIFSMSYNEKSNDAYYLDANHSVNSTEVLAEQITSAGAGYALPMTLVAAILFLGTVLIVVFSKKRW